MASQSISIEKLNCQNCKYNQTCSQEISFELYSLGELTFCSYFEEDT